MTENLYFAYGSNMNLDQMAYRCPAAIVVENVRLMDYRLAFRGWHGRGGVATILPEKGSYVDGVLWKITNACEHSLDRYEGYPNLYGKEHIVVRAADGREITCKVYTMHEPYKDIPSIPAGVYLNGILIGCRQNKLPIKPVLAAVEQTKLEQREAVGASDKMPKKGRER